MLHQLYGSPFCLRAENHAAVSPTQNLSPPLILRLFIVLRGRFF